MSLIIFVLGIVYFAAHLLAYLFQKTKVPDVLILMVFGILAGPVFHLVEPSDFGQVGQVLVSISLILILFESGTSLDLKVIATCVGPMLFLSLATFLLTAGVISLVTINILGMPVISGLIAGAIMGGTSSAVVIPLVKGLGMTGKPATILILESALTDVICIVVAISLLEAAVSNDLNSATIIKDILLKSLLLSSLIGIIAGFLWLSLLTRIRKLPNNLYTTFAFVFLIYGLSEFVGTNGAIASLALGITLANNRRSDFTLFKKIKVEGLSVVTKTERLVFSEMVFLLKTFFFLFLGVSLSFSNGKLIFIVLLVMALIYFGRIFLTRIVINRKTTWKEASYVSLLIPKGLAAAILAEMPVEAGIEGAASIQSLAFYMVLFSIVLTALLVPMVSGFKPVTSLFRTVFKGYAMEGDTGASDESMPLPVSISEFQEEDYNDD